MKYTMINITRVNATSIHHDHKHKTLTYMREMWSKKQSSQNVLDVIAINLKKKKIIMELNIVLHVNGHMTIRPG